MSLCVLWTEKIRSNKVTENYQASERRLATRSSLNFRLLYVTSGRQVDGCGDQRIQGQHVYSVGNDHQP